ncbi:hypothetical protein L915_07994 [Plasmopara halstedii]|uniref:FYVE-type domain-containing protein n=1 Tax=Plasmopara halstedii TaxID=4781 RepID=A0A0P1AQX5_PLAHL|nr:hypothetical protein L915_07994 [Plasmopara halstedii]CEG43804.1 hypothetical protein L915_07994 [Plasmopara halstedii]|eukprot:XP_024580173.1 hypothetical protein L915_07994 [Plasmopara halstedii]
MEIQHRKRAAIASSFFPVDESLLPHLNISSEQHEELRQYALQAALDTVRDGPTWGRSNIEHAVSSGWKVLSARPTACFLIKQRTRKGKSKHVQTQQSSERLQMDFNKNTPRVPITSLGTFNGSEIDIGQTSVQQRTTREPLGATSGQHFMAHAVLPNSLEDVMNTLYCEHTREMRAMKRKMYGEAALDCCVLQTLEGATLEDPFWYLGLKWVALRSPMHALLASREFVYLEHLGTHIDPNTGRRMLYRVTQSVHVRGYGGRDSYFGLTRGHIEAAFVYWLDDDNEVRNPLLHVCVKGRIHMKGSMPDALVYKYLKSLWRSERSLFPAERLSMSISIVGGDHASKISPKKKKKSRQRKIPNGPPLEMAHEWVADELRPNCSVCNKKFRLISRFKHHCRACGEVICRDCTFRHRVNVRATQSFRGLRATGTPSRDLASEFKTAKKTSLPLNFEETMTCSFDKQVEDEDGIPGEYDASLSIVNARKAVDSPTETAVLGGDSVVCVVMAKVCLSCLHSVPLANRSLQQRRHSEMAFSKALSGAITNNCTDLRLNENYRLHRQSWAPNYKEVEELDSLDDEQSQVDGREQDLPMLVVDDEDTQSVDGVNGVRRRPGSYSIDGRPRMTSLNVRRQSYGQEWSEQEDGTLDSHANNKRVMILSPHALSTSSSITSTQLNQFMERTESSYASSGHSRRVISSDTDNESNYSIQFYPTQVKCEEPEDSQGRPSSCTADFDPNSLFNIPSEEHELAAVANATVTATERVMRRMRDLQNDSVYQTRYVPSPSMSTTSLCSDDEDLCNEIDESMQDLRQALAKVENSLADQARILLTIEQECKKEGRASTAATVQA